MHFQNFLTTLFPLLTHLLPPTSATTPASGLAPTPTPIPRFREIDCFLSGIPETRNFTGPAPKTSTKYCATVGSPCRVDDDCKYDKVTYLCPKTSGVESYAGVGCYKGFCRVAGVVAEGNRCDCLAGCLASDGGKEFNCMNNVCKNY